MGINQVNISGNITSDSEIREGKATALSFTVAVNEGYKNSSGEWVETVNFIDCVIFGEKRASALKQYLTKGSKVFISGKLRVSTYETSSGDVRKSAQVVVDNIEFVTKKSES